MENIRDEVLSLHCDLYRMYNNLDKDELLTLYKQKANRIEELKDNNLNGYLEMSQLLIEGGTIFDIFMKRYNEDVQTIKTYEDE